MNKILVIDESTVFRDFVQSFLEYQGYVVFKSRSAFDGLNQLRKNRPDLVIVDDRMNRQSINNLLQKKNDDINLKDIPVVFTSHDFNQDRIVELCKSKIRRFVVKPVKADQFFSTISSFFKNDIFIDESPCQLDLHVNENLVLVEVAKGFNHTKMELLPWKIREIMDKNQIQSPKILLMVSDVIIDDESQSILERLIGNFIGITGENDDIKVLTSDKFVKSSIVKNSNFTGIDICNNLIEAINAFFGKKGLESLTNNQDTVHEMYLATGKSMEVEGEIDLNYKDDPLR